MTKLRNGLAITAALLLTAGAAIAAAPRADIRLPQAAAQASARALSLAIDALPFAKAALRPPVVRRAGALA